MKITIISNGLNLLSILCNTSNWFLNIKSEVKKAHINIHNKNLLSNINSKITLTGKNVNPLFGRRLKMSGTSPTEGRWWSSGYNIPHQFLMCTGMLKPVLKEDSAFRIAQYFPTVASLAWLQFSYLLDRPTQSTTVFRPPFSCYFPFSSFHKPPLPVKSATLCSTSSKCLFHSMSLPSWYETLCIPLIKPQSSPTQKIWKIFTSTVTLRVKGDLIFSPSHAQFCLTFY